MWIGGKLQKRVFDDGDKSLDGYEGISVGRSVGPSVGHTRVEIMFMSRF